jgi:hypothetical protein
MRNTILLMVVLGAAACGPDDGTRVTGGPTQGHTADYEQAEAVATVAYEDPWTDVLTVAFNDRTEADPYNPLTIYPHGVNGEDRILKHGASMMGWSFSRDEGRTFSYGGKLSPPAGWAALWGDPALTTVGGTEGTTVYYSNLAMSDTNFPPDGELWCYRGVSCMSPRMDGFCVARSLDSGVQFQDIACFKKGRCSNTGVACRGDFDCIVPPTAPGGPTIGSCKGIFYDGASLAAIGGSVYFASSDFDRGIHDVWRSDDGQVDFRLLDDPSPFDEWAMADHPRLKAFGSRLYIVGISSNRVILGSYLDLAPGSTGQWSPPRVLAYYGVPYMTLELSDRTVRFADQFSYAIGPDESGEGDVLRVIHTYENPATGRFSLHTMTCPADLRPRPGAPLYADCAEEPGWTHTGLAFDEFGPLLAVAGTPSRWKALWLGRSSSPNGNRIDVIQGNLAVLPGGTKVLIGQEIVRPQTPCSAGDLADSTDTHYWGDYNDLIQLGALSDYVGPTPRFFSPFTDNRDGCDFQGYWTADMHVGGVVFQ